MSLVKVDADGVILLVEAVNGWVRLKVGVVADLELSVVEANDLAAKLTITADVAAAQ